MSLNLRRWRNISLWLGVGILISPLGFNCHSRTDQSPAVSSQEPRPDDADQTVRAMASDADGAPQGESKIRLSGEVTISAAKATQLGMASKLGSSDDVIVPKGTSLLALYDNECRENAGLASGKALRFEAQELKPTDDIALSALVTQADADPCLVRVDENHVRQMIAPISEDARQAFANSANSVSALATTNDPRVAEQRQITFSKALQAWDWFYSGSGIATDVVVAVVDTGILHTHPDLVDNVYTNNQGFHGYDFVNNDNDPLDDYGHGTHVAGIIGARAGNGIGVTGVIGTRVRLMGVKVLDNQGSGSDTTIVNGIRYAADQGAHVINLSLGGQFTSTAIRDAMTYAVNRGSVLIIAAGNDNVLMNATDSFYAPSGYARDIPGSIAVGSVDAVGGARSAFSNYSTTYVYIAAPGSNGILSTYTGNTYTTLQGTSMAAPVVAGAAALLVGSFRTYGLAYTPADVIGLLVDSSRSVTALNTVFRNGATLDIERAAKLFYSRYIMAGNGGTEVQ